MSCSHLEPLNCSKLSAYQSVQTLKNIVKGAGSLKKKTHHQLMAHSISIKYVLVLSNQTDFLKHFFYGISHLVLPLQFPLDGALSHLPTKFHTLLSDIQEHQNLQVLYPQLGTVGVKLP